MPWQVVYRESQFPLHKMEVILIPHDVPILQRKGKEGKGKEEKEEGKDEGCFEIN